MRFAVVFLGLLALSLNALAEVEVEDNVLVLNADNFDSAVQDAELMLVEFYAPWCGHCKTLAPQYSAAAALLQPLGVKLAKVNADAEENKPLAGRFEVKGYPTLKVFRNGHASEYEGGRVTDEIVSYMKRQAAPAVTAVNDTQQLESILESGDVTVVGFFEKEDSDEEKKFNTVASGLRNTYTFVSVVGQPSIASSKGAEGAYSVIVFKKFDEKKNVLTTAEFDSLEASVKKFGTPLVDEIGPTNYKNYVDAKLPLAYLFIKADQKETEVAKIHELAQSTRGQLSFVWIDGDKFMRHGQNLGLSGNTIPAFVIEELSTGLHYVYGENLPVEKSELTEFVTKYLAKELEPSVKSEEIPASNDGAVKILVGKNFDEIVKDPTKHVLVEFYAPWCGHCKTLAPVWEELGLQYLNSADIVIAKIDATANDVPASLNVRGFPTIKLFTKEGKDQPIDFEGNRSKDDFVTFLSQHTGAVAADDQKDEL